MANPNIVSVATINGNTAVANVTTVISTLVTNSAASGKVYKVNALYLTNVTSGTVAYANVDIVRSTNSYKLINSMDVPYKATIDAISKSLYLLEGDTLRVQAATNSTIQAICSFEEIS
jgi:hypothetical protein